MTDHDATAGAVANPYEDAVQITVRPERQTTGDSVPVLVIQTLANRAMAQDPSRYGQDQIWIRHEDCAVPEDQAQNVGHKVKDKVNGYIRRNHPTFTFGVNAGGVPYAISAVSAGVTVDDGPDAGTTYYAIQVLTARGDIALPAARAAHDAALRFQAQAQTDGADAVEGPPADAPDDGAPDAGDAPDA